MKEFSYGIAPYCVINNEVFIFVSKFNSTSLYGFVKGKISFNESFQQCAVREFKEEVNLFIDNIYLESFFCQSNRKKDIGIFLVDVFNINFSNLKLNKELYSFELLKLDNCLYSKFQKNQTKILNNLFLYFKNLNSFILKNKFK